MSEIKKHPLNAEGKYYVDSNSCLNHCCFDIAPNNFKVDENLQATGKRLTKKIYVKKQRCVARWGQFTMMGIYLYEENV